MIDAILAKHRTDSDLGELSTTSESKPWETPVPQKITPNDFPANPILIRSNMLYIPLSGFSARAINHLKRIASFKNPEFYAREVCACLLTTFPVSFPVPIWKRIHHPAPWM